VDTAGRALDFLSADIIRSNPKMGRGGALSLQGYGQLKSRFSQWLNSLKTIGKDIVLIAHSSEDKSGDDVIERLDVQGGSKGEIYKSADAMGRLNLVGGKRFMNFSPTDTAFGKNPGAFEPLEVPSAAGNCMFLGDVIAQIKTKLNAMSEEQSRRQSAIADWDAKIQEATDVEDYSFLAQEAQKCEKAIVATVKGMVHKAATERGFTYDKVKGEYLEAQTA